MFLEMGSARHFTHGWSGGTETNVSSASGFSGIVFLRMNCEHTEINAKSQTSASLRKERLEMKRLGSRAGVCLEDVHSLTQCARPEKNEERKKKKKTFSSFPSCC